MPGDIFPPAVKHQEHRLRLPDFRKRTERGEQEAPLPRLQLGDGWPGGTHSAEEMIGFSGFGDESGDGVDHHDAVADGPERRDHLPGRSERDVALGGGSSGEDSDADAGLL